MAQLNLGKLRLKWRGAWSASNTYYLNDVVRYNGSSYIAVSDNFVGAGTPDVTTAQWDTMALAHPATCCNPRAPTRTGVPLRTALMTPSARSLT